MIRPVEIQGRLVGPSHACFVIAEAGVNHNGDMLLAHRLIDEAARAGADAVKFQSFVTEDLITPYAPKAEYQVVTTGESGSQAGMLKALELSAAQQAELKTHCRDAGIIYLCTPYENSSVDLLDLLDVAAYKIASTDTNNAPFLRHVASKGRPVVLSTGMSSLGEVEAAMSTLRASGLDGRIVLLHCTAEYPAPIEEANLRAISTLRQAFACPVGFSDHTPGIGASPWAVATGACSIEKHFTLDRSMAGPDHRASLEPAEMARLVHEVRQVEFALGDGVKRAMPSEARNKSRMQRSLVAARHIRAGDTIDAEMLVCKRPGTGLSPEWMDRVVGRRAALDVQKDEMLNLGCVDWR
jgi:N,N'-diacetyllegionaminate synthase